MVLTRGWYYWIYGLGDGEEVVQVYIHYLNEQGYLPSRFVPIHTLQAVKRIPIQKGEIVRVEFELNGLAFHLIDLNGKKMIYEGTYEIEVGGGQKQYTSHVIQRIVVGGDSMPLEECTSTPYYCPTS